MAYRKEMEKRSGHHLLLLFVGGRAAGKGSKGSVTGAQEVRKPSINYQQ